MKLSRNKHKGVAAVNPYLYPVHVPAAEASDGSSLAQFQAVSSVLCFLLLLLWPSLLMLWLLLWLLFLLLWLLFLLLWPSLLLFWFLFLLHWPSHSVWQSPWLNLTDR